MLINTFQNENLYHTQNTPCRVVATPSLGNSVDKPSTSTGLCFVMSTIEVWKPLNGYESIYEVSNLGRVRSVDHYTIKFGYQKCLKKGKLKKLFLNKHGYCITTLSKRQDVKMKTVTVHRLVATAFLPNDGNLPLINHKNGIKTDNRVENLEWCTINENAEHASKNGLLRPAVGEKSHHSKISDLERIDLYNMYNSGARYKKMAAKYGLTIGAVYHILHKGRFLREYIKTITDEKEQKTNPM